MFHSFFLLTGTASAEWKKGFCNTSVDGRNRLKGNVITVQATWIYNVKPGKSKGHVLIATFKSAKDTSLSTKLSDISGTTATYEVNTVNGVPQTTIKYSNSSSPSDEWSASMISYSGKNMTFRLKHVGNEDGYEYDAYSSNDIYCSICDINDDECANFEKTVPFNKFSDKWKKD